MDKIVDELLNLRSDYLKLLYRMVAEHLTKRRVRIEHKDELVIDDSRGVALRDGDIGVIHLRSDMDPESVYKSFLHECSHIKLHFSGLSDVKDVSSVLEVLEQSGRKHAPEWYMEKRRKEHEKREYEARELSTRFLEYADQHSKEERIDSKLLALLDFTL